MRSRAMIRKINLDSLADAELQLRVGCHSGKKPEDNAPVVTNITVQALFDHLPAIRVVQPDAIRDRQPAGDLPDLRTEHLEAIGLAEPQAKAVHGTRGIRRLAYSRWNQSAEAHVLLQARPQSLEITVGQRLKERLSDFPEFPDLV
jgi:hypothetical protein